MDSFFNLEGRVAVVTGGGSGIGKAVVERLARAGARVVIGDLNDCPELAAEVNGLSVPTDVSDEAQVRKLLQTAVEHFGGLDILVNNAGIFASYKRLEETSAEDFRRCFNINLLGAFYGIKHAAGLMNEGGRIINTASLAGKTGFIDLGSYGASKFSVVGLTQTAALELCDRGIRVNAICPTSVNTPMAQEEGGEALLAMEKTLVPLNRICEPEEAAAAIHFLAADDCGFINGQAINLCGGWSAGLNERVWQTLGQQAEQQNRN